MQTTRELAATTPQDLLATLADIRTASEGDTIILYGIALEFHSHAIVHPDGCYLTTKDSERVDGCWVYGVGKVHHLRAGKEIGGGPAVFPHKEAMCEAIASGNCNLTGP